MNPEIKQRWVKALRSGKYSQTTSALQNEDGYCCLGVLCDVIKNDDGAKDFIEISPNGLIQTKEERLTLAGFMTSTNDGSLVAGLLELIGLSDPVESALMNMIDDDKLSFSEIADHIEANL